MTSDLTYCIYDTTATPEHIDPNNHINNIVYLQWMQDSAIEHVKQNNVYELTQPLGLTWFAKQHTIEYISQGFLGDQIRVVTWVEELTKISTLRKYQIFRKTDKKLLCKGETRWVMVNAEKSKPTKIPQDVLDLISVADDSNIADLV
jgi:acyl-CoA thioester hydrolase